MIMKLRSIGKLLGRNFSSSAGTAPNLRKPIETAKKFSGGSVGLLGGYGLAVATLDNRSQYIITQEKRTMDHIEVTKKLLRETAKDLRELEGDC